GVVPAGLDGETQLRAYAVGARDQHRLAVAGRQLDQGTEAADAGEHFAALRTLHQRFDSLDQLIAGVDIDAGIAIGETRAFCHESWSVRGGPPSVAGAYGIVPAASRWCAIDPDNVAIGPSFNHREAPRARVSREPVRARRRAAVAVSCWKGGAGLRSRRRRPVRRRGAGRHAAGAG